MELYDLLINEGYLFPRLINGEWCAIERFMFTTGLVVGLDHTGKRGRYCYHTYHEAIEAFNEFENKGDPIGNWIKYKGIDGERSNQNYRSTDYAVSLQIN